MVILMLEGEKKKEKMREEIREKKREKKRGKKRGAAPLKRKFYYLKDAWRVAHDGIEMEGLILEELNAGNVPFVPTVACHGDVPGFMQTTDWERFWHQYHPDKTEEECPLKKQRHYRVAVEEVGKTLEDFGDSSQSLVVAILCCLIGMSRWSSLRSF